MLPDYITLVELFGAPTGFRSPYCWLTTSDDSHFTTGALLWAQRRAKRQSCVSAGPHWSREKESNLQPPPSQSGALSVGRSRVGRRTRTRTGAPAFGGRRSLHLSYTALAAGIRFERTPWRLTAACPTNWATLLYWSRRLGSNQRPPRSKRGMLPLHHTWICCCVRARGTTWPAARARRGLGGRTPAPRRTHVQWRKPGDLHPKHLAVLPVFETGPSSSRTAPVVAWLVRFVAPFALLTASLQVVWSISWSSALVKRYFRDILVYLGF
jgi:hypothetical protein